LFRWSCRRKSKGPGQLSWSFALYLSISIYNGD
jgi:hypothetical protein